MRLDDTTSAVIQLGLLAVMGGLTLGGYLFFRQRRRLFARFVLLPLWIVVFAAITTMNGRWIDALSGGIVVVGAYLLTKWWIGRRGKKPSGEGS
ncbi:MAG TPA: hypothetical protein VHX64_04875 [Caulobacteraceae bacterium]|jgi:hypothetical protein|nr:hypothetical protein [Caulobacteraceae bacterium]